MSEAGFPQEKVEVPTIDKSAWLPPSLKYHFFKTSINAVYPSEMYRPDSFKLEGGRPREYAYSYGLLLTQSATARKLPGISRSDNIVETVFNASQFVEKMFASIHHILVPRASACDFKMENYGTLKTTNVNQPIWLKDAANINDSTKCDIVPLINGFSGILDQKDKQNSIFNFSLVSSNHSHNLPVAFSFYAFNNAIKYPVEYQLKGEAGNYKRIVINFDYHPDTSLPTKETKSAAWGGALFYNQLKKNNKDAKFDSIADLYISIGNDGDKESKTNTITYTLPIVGGLVKRLTQSKTSFSLDQIKDFGAVWDYIKEKAGVNDTNKALVYITWDRDIGSDGCTNWSLQLPALDRGDVNTSICNCIRKIKNDGGLVVGFDVTGLPDGVDTIRKDCVQNIILDKEKDVLLPRDDNYIDSDRDRIGGVFIVPKDDEGTFRDKNMTHHISVKALNYYFTMIVDISMVLLTLRENQYLIDS